MRTGCIIHPPRTPLVPVRADYLGICDGSQPAAVILAILEYWTDVKLEDAEQIRIENDRRRLAGLDLLETEPWIYKSGEQFLEDGLGLLKEHHLAPGLQLLLDKGYIRRRNNPRFRWDRTFQYLLEIDTVNQALSAWAQVCIPRPHGMDAAPARNQYRAGTEAIPESLKIPTTPTTGAGDGETPGFGMPPQPEPPRLLSDSDAESVYRKVTSNISMPVGRSTDNGNERDLALGMIKDLAIAKGDGLIEYLRPFWLEWRFRHYSAAGFGWLLDWAAVNEIPKRPETSGPLPRAHNGARNGKKGTPAQPVLTATAEQTQAKKEAARQRLENAPKVGSQ